MRWSPNGSIASEILRDALHTLDHHKIFDQSNGKKPFLLLDGHGSRFKLSFLRHVANPDHQWMVCIGVMYRTSLSFVRVDKKLKAIADCGWSPLNYCLLMNPQILATITKLESESFTLMLKKSTYSNSNQHMTINTGSLTTISTVTNDPAIKTNYDSSYL